MFNIEQFSVISALLVFNGRCYFFHNGMSDKLGWTKKTFILGRETEHVRLFQAVWSHVIDWSITITKEKSYPTVSVTVNNQKFSCVDLAKKFVGTYGYWFWFRWNIKKYKHSIYTNLITLAPLTCSFSAPSPSLVNH